jgi:anti-anti-sigma factor
MPDLKIDVDHQDAVYVVRVIGKLDMDGVPDLDQVLAEAETSKTARILLDLQDLDSIDASGLECLLVAARRSASNGQRLQIIPGAGEVARIFQVTDVDMTLPLTDSPVINAARWRSTGRSASHPLPHPVSFHGPRLTDAARAALSGGGAFVVQHQESAGGGSGLEYLVSVAARDSEDAVGRVRRALRDWDAYSGFRNGSRRPV